MRPEAERRVFPSPSPRKAGGSSTSRRRCSGSDCALGCARSFFSKTCPRSESPTERTTPPLQKESDATKNRRLVDPLQRAGLLQRRGGERPVQRVNLRENASPLFRDRYFVFAQGCECIASIHGERIAYLRATCKYRGGQNLFRHGAASFIGYNSIKPT